MREASADELRRMVAAQLLAAAAPPVRPWKPCSSTPIPSPPMAASAADDLADLLATVLAYGPQHRAWPRPRPPWLRCPTPAAACPACGGLCGSVADPLT